MLPWVIRKLGLSYAGRNERAINRAEERKARSEAVEAAIERLAELAAERNLSSDLLEAHRAQRRAQLKHIGDQSDGDDAIRKT